MKASSLVAALAVVIVGFWTPSAAHAAPISVVVAENFWGEPVKAIGGGKVSVTEIMSGANADPHDFEPTASNAKAVADAAIVIYTGIDYDAWMDKLVVANKSAKRTIINVGTLLKRKGGDNPHLWYDPAAMPALVDTVVTALTVVDPAGAAGYAERAEAYRTQLRAITARIAAVKAKYAKTPVTATEPVFGYMAQALGLEMRNQSFQRAVMNETEPSAKETVAMENDLKGAKVKALFYNSQVTDSTTERLIGLARSAKVPVVAVTETKPADKSYIEWMLAAIDATEKALAGPAT